MHVLQLGSELMGWAWMRGESLGGQAIPSYGGGTLNHSLLRRVTVDLYPCTEERLKRYSNKEAGSNMHPNKEGEGHHQLPATMEGWCAYGDVQQYAN